MNVKNVIKFNKIIFCCCCGEKEIFLYSAPLPYILNEALIKIFKGGSIFLNKGI